MGLPARRIHQQFSIIGSLYRLADATTITQRAALALFQDVSKGGDVMATINRRYGHQAGTAFKVAKQGTHTGHDGDLVQLSRATERFVLDLEEGER